MSVTMPMRLIDLDTGDFIDLDMPAEVLTCFKAQLNKTEYPEYLDGFRLRLEYRLANAIMTALDLALQRPLFTEVTQAYYISATRNVPLPAEVLNNRAATLKYLRKFPWDETIDRWEAQPVGRP
jgi:hypothetical protein